MSTTKHYREHEMCLPWSERLGLSGWNGSDQKNHFPISRYRPLVPKLSSCGTMGAFQIEPARLRKPTGDEVLAGIVSTGLCHADVLARTCPQNSRQSNSLIYQWLLAIGECRVEKTHSLLPILNVNHAAVEP